MSIAINKNKYCKCTTKWYESARWKSRNSLNANLEGNKWQWMDKKKKQI